MKTALITGCSGGVGSALTKAFKQAGYFVVGQDRKPAQPDSEPSVFIQCDLNTAVQEPAMFDTFINDIRAAMPSNVLSALINNAAIQYLGDTSEISGEIFQESFRVNVTTPFLLTQAFLKNLRAESGAVLNIGSVHARATKPGFVAYATSKSAIDGLTRALAVDLGPDIRVLALAPAAVATPMLMAGFEGKPDAFEALAEVHPVKRIATPSEVADLALFLVSEQASFLTGTTVYADGGVLSRLHDPV